MSERRLVRTALALGVVSYGLMLVPGVVLIVGLATVAAKGVVFTAALLRPRGWDHQALARAAVGAGIVVWPLAHHVDLDATRETGSEAKAVNIIHTVQAAEAVYQAAHGYYDSLECLVQGSCMPNTPYPSRFLAADLVRATKTGGYRFLFFGGPKAQPRSADSISASGVTSYALVAIPFGEGAAARRAFCGDASQAIFVSPEGHTPHVADGRCLETGRRLP